LWNLRHIMDVCFYFVNPCVNDFWYDCISEKDLVKRWSNHRFKNQIAEYSIGNELLTSWGKVSQELYSQLFLLDDEVFSCLDYVDSEYYPKTLLGHLQRDIHENVRANSGEIRFEKELFLDNSIQIKSNYTEAREVEVLYDYLVNLIDIVYEGSLQPHDVVVMLPDVEKYLPFIKAVFDHSPKKIPYLLDKIFEYERAEQAGNSSLHF
jgi:exodeoxyribonuclease V gamma subunit